MTRNGFRTRNLLQRVYLVLVLVALPSLGFGMPEDSLIVVGAGNSGGWFTEVTVSNTTTSNVTWQVSREPGFIRGGGCPGDCPFHLGLASVAGTQQAIPQNSVTLGSVTSLYVTTEGASATALTVRARVVNSSRPTQAVEVPVFRLSTIIALNPRVLVFPGAKRDAVSRTNLVLATIPRPNQVFGDVTLTLEAYSKEGQLLGSETIGLRGETRFLVDVLARLGVTTLDVGQIRVTKVAGDEVFWGTMFTTTTDGGVSVSVGAHP